MIQKRCLREQCGKIYKLEDQEFGWNECLCGAPLQTFEIEEKLIDDIFETIEILEPKQEEPQGVPITTPFFVDSYGYLFLNNNQERMDLPCDRLILYVGGSIYKEFPLERSETIIGRNSRLMTVDIDLSVVDPEQRISREHAIIHCENGHYYVENRSAKNSLHCNKKLVAYGYRVELNDGDIITLSKYMMLEFAKKDGGQNVV